MRRPKIHTATRGALTGQGPTKTAAKEDLEKQITWALASHGRLWVEARYGYVLIVNRTLTGWQSTLVMPEHIEAHGKERECSSFTSAEVPFGKVKQSLRIHAAQAAWSHETLDAAHVEAAGLDEEGTRELMRWVNFQRSYRAHIVAGESDSEAFRLACLEN